MRASPASLAGCLAAVALTLSACATPHHGACAGGDRRRTVELIFGRSIKGAADVSETDFADFLDKDVSSRFPLGLTVTDAQGRWRSADGQFVREPSKMVLIVLPGSPDDRTKLEAVRQAYKQRFHQEAVLQVLSHACVSF